MNKELSIKIMNELLYTLKLSKQEFAKSIGIKRQKIYDILNPKNASKISDSLAEVIAETYPQISKEYLFTGSGMILNAEAINENATKYDIIKSLEKISDSVLNNSQANIIYAEAFNRLTKNQERIIAILETKY